MHSDTIDQRGFFIPKEQTRELEYLNLYTKDVPLLQQLLGPLEPRTDFCNLHYTAAHKQPKICETVSIGVRRMQNKYTLVNHKTTHVLRGLHFTLSLNAANQMNPVLSGNQLNKNLQVNV